MNREDIIRMVRESCDKDKVDAWQNGFWVITQEELERFAALIATAERNHCSARADIALLGADRALRDRVLKAINIRKAT